MSSFADKWGFNIKIEFYNPNGTSLRDFTCFEHIHLRLTGRRVLRKRDKEKGIYFYNFTCVQKPLVDGFVPNLVHGSPHGRNPNFVAVDTGVSILQGVKFCIHLVCGR